MTPQIMSKSWRYSVKNTKEPQKRCLNPKTKNQPHRQRTSRLTSSTMMDLQISSMTRRHRELISKSWFKKKSSISDLNPNFITRLNRRFSMDLDLMFVILSLASQDSLLTVSYWGSNKKTLSRSTSRGLSFWSHSPSNDSCPTQKTQVTAYVTLNSQTCVKCSSRSGKMFLARFQCSTKQSETIITSRLIAVKIQFSTF